MEIGNNAVAAQRQPLSPCRKHLLSTQDTDDVPYWISMCRNDLLLKRLFWLLIVTTSCLPVLDESFPPLWPLCSSETTHNDDVKRILGTFAHLLLSMHSSAPPCDFHSSAQMTCYAGDIDFHIKRPSPAISLDSSLYFIMFAKQVCKTLAKY